MVRGERVLESNPVYQGRMINLRVDSVELPSGRRTTREIVEHTDSVVVVAINAYDNVILVKQFRTAVGDSLIEVPAGKREPGESPLECAIRELEEETGYSAGNIEQLGGFYAGPGYSTEYLHLFLATDLKREESNTDDDEISDVLLVSLNEALQMIFSGEICDAKSVAGLLKIAVGRLEMP
ncbi:MAG: NUDIX hydrolase [Dehalococcoidia bacterium]